MNKTDVVTQVSQKTGFTAGSQYFGEKRLCPGRLPKNQRCP